MKRIPAIAPLPAPALAGGRGIDCPAAVGSVLVAR